MTTTGEPPFKAVLDEFQKNILELDNKMRALREKEQWTVEEACNVLAAIASFKSQVGIIMHDQENYLIEFMTSNNTEMVLLDSGESVIKEMPRNRKAWKHKELAEMVASRIENLAYNMDTGERVLTTQQMITKLLDYAAPSYWRVTTLSEIGINADDYCQAGDPEPKISIRKVK